MMVFAQGLGLVTPLGSDVAEVFRRVADGEAAPLVDVANAETSRMHMAAPVPAAATAHLGREPRLRRASPISMLGAAAGKAALADAGLEKPERMAIVFGVSSGGVQYTRRFYEQVVKQGANAASSMLFPETVYNAPASHLAAMLGVDGATYTLVGDGTVGLQALHFGAQLIAMGDADHVLVVAAEELDWILLEAHGDWGLLRDARRSGAALAEGAAAVLLGNSGDVRVHAFAGHSFCKAKDSERAMADAVREAVAAVGVPDVVIGGENGTWVDRALARVVEAAVPGARVLTPKRQLGESLGAGSLVQVVLGAEALRQMPAERALIASLGWNQQAAAAAVERATPRGDSGSRPS